MSEWSNPEAPRIAIEALRGELRQAEERSARAEAEVAELRGALEEIERRPSGHEGWTAGDYADELHRCQEAARRDLRAACSAQPTTPPPAPDTLGEEGNH